MRPLLEYTLGKCVLAAAVVLASAAITLAHVRLIHSGNGIALRWNTPSNVSIVINAVGSDDIADKSHITALRNAIRAWNSVPGSTVHLSEDSSPAQMARTDWQSSSVHLIMFDENDSSGYFPNGTGIVALTPVWFSNSGVITDADILFNGQDFEFTTSGVPGRFDVQDVATHELGHVLGLDHTDWAGGTMYPYVDPTIILHRSLSEDEVHGMRECYPAGSFGSISGLVRRASNGTRVPGANVVAVDSLGRTAAAALAANDGSFQVSGLDPDTYTLYVTPFEGPASSGNLGGGHSVVTSFGTTAFGSVPVALAQAVDLGDVLVDADVAIGLGRTSDTFPVRCIKGNATPVVLHGTNLVSGSTLTISDPTINLGSVSWSGSSVSFVVTVPMGAPDGQVDLTATNSGGAKSSLTGGLEITPPNPSVNSLSPASGSISGGTAVTIHGQDFHAGLLVVIGPNIYADGDIGGVSVIDSTTLSLTTKATPFGVADVVVIDASGVEGRKPAGFSFRDVPAIDSLFPLAGYAGGGTQITLRGHDFQNGAAVRIDGVDQTQVTFVASGEIDVITGPGLPGGPYVVELQNPSAAIATAAFSYSAAPDPLIASLAPASGKSEGGDTITIHGSNFSASNSVRFGSDAATGLGGVAAGSVTFVDASTLRVVTPAHPGGAQNVLVLEADGQAGIAVGAFTFQSSGGGGGCYTVPISGPDALRESLANALWILVLAAWTLASRMPRRRATMRAR